jgi:hypothetical protein
MIYLFSLVGLRYELKQNNTIYLFIKFVITLSKCILVVTNVKLLKSNVVSGHPSVTSLPISMSPVLKKLTNLPVLKLPGHASKTASNFRVNTSRLGISTHGCCSPCSCHWIGRYLAFQSFLKTKSAQSIPLPFALASVANCFLRIFVGLLKMKDIHIMFPNIWGLTFGLVRVALKLIYGNAPKQK